MKEYDVARTVIDFQDGEDTAVVETSHRKWKGRLESYDIEPTVEKKNGTNTYEIPVNWVRIQRPAQRVWTQAEKDAGAARLAAARAKRFGTDDDDEDEEEEEAPRRNGKTAAKAAPAKAKAKPAARPVAKRRPVDEDEDDIEEDEDIEEFDEDDDDEPVEVVSRKVAPKGRVQIPAAKRKR